MQRLEFFIADSMTSTAGTIPVLRHGTVLATNMLVLAPEIILVTGRTVRFVLGRGPGNVGADGISMAAGTARVFAVIARVVIVRVMAEVGRCPAVGVMTYVALRGRG